MSGLQQICMTLCCTCVAVSILSFLAPQKRTRRVMGFVIGLFFISTIVSAAASHISEIDLNDSAVPDFSVPTYNESDYQHEIAQMTADNVTEALNELLINEGIRADDIQLTLKISDKGSITVARAVIYISEAYEIRIDEIESIVYRNIAKEPEVYVNGQTLQ